MHQPPRTKKKLQPEKKSRENFIGRKNPENIFPGVREISGKYF
jgi:hypothetical protein